ncbi:hypothetical protein BYT27DRAFT_7261868 [Phlegmacium glaucopus]|nr:hypothetical protein BYT27DRAFT_7261868 [Phlegmacium glaucopus]
MSLYGRLLITVSVRENHTVKVGSSGGDPITAPALRKVGCPMFPPSPRIAVPPSASVLVPRWFPVRMRIRVPVFGHELLPVADHVVFRLLSITLHTAPINGSRGYVPGEGVAVPLTGGSPCLQKRWEQVEVLPTRNRRRR